MNNTDLEYQRLLQLILEKGRWKNNRTGTKTLGVFGAQARFDLQEGFPLLTTKKVHYRAIIHELLWFIRGDTNIKYLVDNDVHIWNGDCYRKYRDTKPEDLRDPNDWRCEIDDQPIRKYTQEEFIKRIRSDSYFASRWGDLGQGTYGQMWRAFPYYVSEYAIDNGTGFKGTVDQLQKVIDTLKTNPDSRRIIVNAWHPYYVDTVALPPCHVLYIFGTEELTEAERLDLWQKKHCKFTMPDGKVIITAGLPNLFDGSIFNKRFDEDNIPKRRINCIMMQRSLDTPLGGPFNVASYSLLLSMIAQVVNMVPGEFIWSIADAHIYENQIDGVKEQLKREPKKLPTLWLNPEIKDLFQFKFEDIRIEGYNPHPKIDFPLSTG